MFLDSNSYIAIELNSVMIRRAIGLRKSAKETYSIDSELELALRKPGPSKPPAAEALSFGLMVLTYSNQFVYVYEDYCYRFHCCYCHCYQY